MIIDARNEFCDATALNTGAAGDYVIGNVMDLTVARDIGNGQPLYLVATVDTAATSGGAATLQLSLATDDNASLASPTKLMSTQAIAVASLTAGRTIVVAAIPSSANFERYVGIVQTTGVAAFTAGKVNAFLTADPAGWKAYNDGI